MLDLSVAAEDVAVQHRAFNFQVWHGLANIQQFPDDGNHAVAAIDYGTRAFENIHRRFQPDLLKGLPGEGVLHDREVDIVFGKSASHLVGLVSVDTSEAHNSNRTDTGETPRQFLANHLFYWLAHYATSTSTPGVIVPEMLTFLI